uniref:Uncharacterized protein n=1 Tax=viral metagenome TaxID=1070528 RepID=A0A6M3JMP4_9ZZZZ
MTTKFNYTGKARRTKKELAFDIKWAKEHKRKYRIVKVKSTHPSYKGQTFYKFYLSGK